MNLITTFALIAAVTVGAGTATYAVSAPSTVPEAIVPSKVLDYSDYAGFEDRRSDDQYYGSRKTKSVPNVDEEVVRRAGMVRVKEIEFDDGLIEVEGYDAQGREIKFYMDRDGKKILSKRFDDRWDDRWDD